MKIKYKIVLILLIILAAGYLLPQHFRMPVEGASRNDFNPNTFWYYPWGRSVTHKGVDIFAAEGTNIRPSVSGLVIYSGNIDVGGNIVVILGPRWRFHYYAHLQTTEVNAFSFAGKNRIIGTVGSSGNAAGKPAHLHYSIVTPLPYFWRVDKSRQGWKKMFYLNPLDDLSKISG